MEGARPILSQDMLFETLNALNIGALNLADVRYCEILLMSFEWVEQMDWTVQEVTEAHSDPKKVLENVPQEVNSVETSCQDGNVGRQGSYPCTTISNLQLKYRKTITHNPQKSSWMEVCQLRN